MRKFLILVLVLVALFVGAVTAANLGLPSPVVITKEGEQKLILLFGDVRTSTTPGISFMIPFVEEARSYPARWLHSRTEALPIQTKDGEQLLIDNYTVWRIVDAVKFQASFPTGRGAAEQRIDRQVRDAVREVIGRHTLAEVLKGKRAQIMDRDHEARRRRTRCPTKEYGITVADVRINRTELPAGTRGESVYARMSDGARTPREEEPR